MSHYFAAVVVPADTNRDNAEDRVKPIMEPYYEEAEIEQRTDEDGSTYWHNPQGKWDWWQVGGRWTGVWSDYDPQTDPANLERCIHCGGTGRRPDADQLEVANPGWLEWSGGCNGCMGKGMAVKWPTDFQARSEDVVPVAYYLDTPGVRVPFAVVIPDGGWHEKETWIWDEEKQQGHFEEVPEAEWAEQVTKLLTPCRGAKLVVVDYHD